MVDLARLLRLKPARAAITEAEALATVTAFRRDFQCHRGTLPEQKPKLTVDLVWGLHGRAVWRFENETWPPELGMVGVFESFEVDAQTGVLVRAGARLR